MIDQHHYGSSKSAVYLADLLSDKLLMRKKIDRLMNFANKRFRDITFSNITGSTKIWCLTQALQDSNTSLSKFDKPFSSVAQNVVKSYYKESLRTISALGDVDKRGRAFPFKESITPYEDKLTKKLAKFKKVINEN